MTLTSWLINFLCSKDSLVSLLHRNIQNRNSYYCKSCIDDRSRDRCDLCRQRCAPGTAENDQFNGWPDKVYPVSAIDFESEEYQKIPSKVRDLMKCDSISIEKLKEVIFLKGFFPKDTPIENMPNDFWEFIASNWSNLKDFITETEMQF